MAKVDQQAVAVVTGRLLTLLGRSGIGPGEIVGVGAELLTRIALAVLGVQTSSEGFERSKKALLTLLEEIGKVIEAEQFGIGRREVIEA